MIQNKKTLAKLKRREICAHQNREINVLRKFELTRYIWVCFFPHYLRFIGSLAIWKFFFSVLKEKSLALTIDRGSYPPATAHLSQKTRLTFATLEKRRDLGPVNFRNDLWDCFRKQGKKLANS